MEGYENMIIGIMTTSITLKLISWTAKVVQIPTEKNTMPGMRTHHHRKAVSLPKARATVYKIARKMISSELIAL